MYKINSKFCRVKLFQDHDVEVLERDMNDFIASVKGIIIDIKFKHNDRNMMTTCMVIYQP